MKKAVMVTGWPQRGKTARCQAVVKEHRFVGCYEIDAALYRCCEIGKIGRVQLQGESSKVSALARRMDIWAILKSHFEAFLARNRMNHVLLDGYNLMYANFGNFYHDLLVDAGFDVRVHLVDGAQLQGRGHKMEGREVSESGIVPCFRDTWGTYQRGHSDSDGKLDLLGLPSLAGKSVLDVGCSEGFFCFEALRSGACLVAGIDQSAEALGAAMGRFEEVFVPGTPFLPIHAAFSSVSFPRRFDVVFALSVLHYEEDFRKAAKMLADAAGEMAVFEGPLWPGSESVTIDGGQHIPPREAFLSELRRHFSGVDVVSNSIFPAFPATWNSEQRAKFFRAKRVVIHCRV